MKSIEQIRLEAGLTVQQLAELAGVDDASYSRIEKGLTVRLQPVTLHKVGNALVTKFAEDNIQFSKSEFIQAALHTRDERLRAIGKLKGRVA